MAAAVLAAGFDFIAAPATCVVRVGVREGGCLLCNCIALRVLLHASLPETS